jgi:hypothetical protein
MSSKRHPIGHGIHEKHEKIKTLSKNISVCSSVDSVDSVARLFYVSAIPSNPAWSPAHLP